MAHISSARYSEYLFKIRDIKLRGDSDRMNEIAKSIWDIKKQKDKEELSEINDPKLLGFFGMVTKVEQEERLRKTHIKR